MTRPTILAIGGTDSSGGAGLAADIRAASALDVTARLAVTAVTAQSDAGVGTVCQMTRELVAEQIALAMADGHVAAVKIGMLGDAATIEAVESALAWFEGPIVLDPVIAASAGGLLLDRAGFERLIERLLPRTYLVTPNLPELDLMEERLGLPPGASIEDKAGCILDRGARAVLVKGGHAEGSVATDILFCRDCPPVRFETSRVPVRLRGTGCMLATAIAAGLAQGQPLVAACEWAKAYLQAQFNVAQRRMQDSID